MFAALTGLTIPSLLLPPLSASHFPHRRFALIRTRPPPLATRWECNSGNPGLRMPVIKSSFRPGSDESDASRLEGGFDSEFRLDESRNGTASSRQQQVPEDEKSEKRQDKERYTSRSLNVLHKKMSLVRDIKCFGVEMSPDTIAVAMVYFVQGVLGLARLVVSFYFKDDLHFDPAETAVFTGFSALPWLIKPLYGFISDSFPLFGYRRRSYLVLSGFLEALSWSMMATFVNSKYSAAFCILLGSLSVAFSDVHKLGFTPEFLGRVKLVTSIASLMGVALYNGFLKNIPLRRTFLIMTIVGTCLGMTQILLVTGLNRQFGMSDEWFAIGDSLILTVLGQASFMPVLVLAARLCPPGVETTLFATLMSISNGASVAGGLIGAGLTQLFGITKDDFTNLPLVIILCNLSSLLPLPLLLSSSQRKYRFIIYE